MSLKLGHIIFKVIIDSFQKFEDLEIFLENVINSKVRFKFAYVKFAIYFRTIQSSIRNVYTEMCELQRENLSFFLNI